MGNNRVYDYIKNKLNDSVDYVKNEWDESGNKIHDALQKSKNGDYSGLGDFAINQAFNTLPFAPGSIKPLSAEVKPNIGSDPEYLKSLLKRKRDELNYKFRSAQDRKFNLSPEELDAMDHLSEEIKRLQSKGVE